MEEMKKYLEEQIKIVTNKMRESGSKAFEYMENGYSYDLAQEYFNIHFLEIAKLELLEEVLDKLEALEDADE